MTFFCIGCNHFRYKEVHSTQLPDSTYSRGPAYMCSNERAIRASQKEPDPGITILPVGKVCWTCRGAYYEWDGKTEKPVFVLMLEASRKAILEEEARKKLEAEKVPVAETACAPVKSKGKIRKGYVSRKRVTDPSKKRKSANQSLGTG